LISFFDILGLACCGEVEIKDGECCHNKQIYKVNLDVASNGGQCCIKLTKICLTSRSFLNLHQDICIGKECFSFGMSDDVLFYLRPVSRWFDSGIIYKPDTRGKEVKCFSVKKSIGESFLSGMNDLVGTRFPYQFTNIGTWGSNCRSFSQIIYNTFENSVYEGDFPPCHDGDIND